MEFHLELLLDELAEGFVERGGPSVVALLEDEIIEGGEVEEDLDDHDAEGEHVHRMRPRRAIHSLEKNSDERQDLE